MRKLFKEHPESVGETYLQHMGSAFGFSAKMLGAALCCGVHGLLPFLFKTKAKDTVLDLHDRVVLHRRRTPPPKISNRNVPSF